MSAVSDHTLFGVVGLVCVGWSVALVTAIVTGSGFPVVRLGDPPPSDGRGQVPI